MLESGVKIEGSEVIPPSPDSFGKQKVWTLSANIYSPIWGAKVAKKKLNSSAIEPSIGIGI